MGYEVFCEAQGYGQVETESAALLAALEEMGAVEDLSAQVMADENRGLLAVVLVMDATSGLDAHDVAVDVWRSAWETAFPEQAPTTMLAIKAVPQGVAAARAARNGDVS